MSERKIVVPEGMLKASLDSYDKRYPSLTGYGYTDVEKEKSRKSGRLFLEDALLWLSENPIVPTDDDLARVRLEYFDKKYFGGKSTTVDFVVGWQRQMFLEPEPNDEPIKDLFAEPVGGMINGVHVNYRVREAYRRGRESR